MKKILWVLLCISLHAKAVEIEGVNVPDTAHLGNSNLILNGVGVRSKFFFDVYVTALYTASRKNSTSAVLSDPGEKRIALQFLSNVNAEDLLFSINKFMVANSSEDELNAIKEGRHDFETSVHKMGRINKRDVILFDYIPGVGTKIMMNGSFRGVIPGAGFSAALLKVWLGEKPMQADMKSGMLGGL